MSTNGVSINGLQNVSGNSVTTILEREVAVNTSGYGIANLVCRRKSDGASKYFTIRVCYKRSSGGVSVSTDLLSPVTGDAIPLALVTATFDASGNNVRLRFTGLLSTDFIVYADWNGTEVVDD